MTDPRALFLLMSRVGKTMLCLLLLCAAAQAQNDAGSGTEDGASIPPVTMERLTGELRGGVFLGDAESPFDPSMTGVLRVGGGAVYGSAEALSDDLGASIARKVPAGFDFEHHVIVSIGLPYYSHARLHIESVAGPIRLALARDAEVRLELDQGELLISTLFTRDVCGRRAAYERHLRRSSRRFEEGYLIDSCEENLHAEHERGRNVLRFFVVERESLEKVVFRGRINASKVGTP